MREMSLPKVLLPPALSLGLLLVIIYGLGSCMSSLPESYRPKRLVDYGAFPEKQIMVVEPEGGSNMTISLFSWGARFSEGAGVLGTLKYERVYYALRDFRGALVWKIISHDTYIAISNPTGDDTLTIARKKGCIELTDAKGKPVSSILLGDGTASLLSPDGDLIVRAGTTESGAELLNPDGKTLLVSGLPISPAGLCCAALTQFSPVERAALMVMVK